MADNLKNKYFIASRGFYGTNSVSYKGIEMEVTKYNHDYANPITSFEWGNSEKGSKLLAYAILNTIATPTVARVYANKFTQHVIEKFKDDEWKMEAIEVARWINTNTDYKIPLNEASEQEAIEKEKRRIKREEEFQKQIEEKLKNRVKNQPNIVDDICSELKIKQETLAKILDTPLDLLNKWRLENEMPKLALKAIEFYKAGVSLKEKNNKLKIESQNFQEQIIKNQTKMDLYEIELKRYKKFINEFDIPNLYKRYKEL